MFLWAVCPTTVEMDLTFVLVVRIYHSDINYQLLLVCVSVCARVCGPHFSVHCQKLN